MYCCGSSFYEISGKRAGDAFFGLRRIRQKAPATQFAGLLNDRKGYYGANEIYIAGDCPAGADCTSKDDDPL